MIAIKDMEMPKCCPGCPLYDNEYGQCKANKDIVINFDERPSNCPFIETVEVQDAVSHQAAIDAIKQVFEWEVIMENDYAIKSRIFERLRQLPSAQPEIVRCKYCKHRYTDECPMRYTEWVERDEYGEYDLRDIVHDYTEDEKFCSEGERRANDSD